MIFEGISLIKNNKKSSFISQSVLCLRIDAIRNKDTERKGFFRLPGAGGS
jgi:hypothetical protein